MLSAPFCLCVGLVMYLSSELLRKKRKRRRASSCFFFKGSRFCEISQRAISFEKRNICSVKFSRHVFEQIKPFPSAFFFFLGIKTGLSFIAQIWKWKIWLNGGCHRQKTDVFEDKSWKSKNSHWRISFSEEFYLHVRCCTGQENDNYSRSCGLCGIILLNPCYQESRGLLQVSGVGALTM